MGTKMKGVLPSNEPIVYEKDLGTILARSVLEQVNGKRSRLIVEKETDTNEYERNGKKEKERKENLPICDRIA
jgi:hypothetical protein